MGCGSDQPIVKLLVDSYTLVLSHQFGLVVHCCEFSEAVDRPTGSALNWLD